MSTNNPGKKADTGKAPVEQGFVQYFPRAIEAVALISAYGAKKYDVPYSDKNWERVENGLGRYADGRSRHITGEYKDGPHDPESEFLHAAHAAWNAMAYLELMLRDGVPLTAPEQFVEVTLAELKSRDAPAATEVDDPTCECGAKESYGLDHTSNCKHYVAPVRGLPQTVHWCAGDKRNVQGDAVDCEKCKTAIYGPRVI